MLRRRQSRIPVRAPSRPDTERFAENVENAVGKSRVNREPAGGRGGRSARRRRRSGRETSAEARRPTGAAAGRRGDGSDATFPRDGRLESLAGRRRVPVGRGQGHRRATGRRRFRSHRHLADALEVQEQHSAGTRRGGRAPFGRARRVGHQKMAGRSAEVRGGQLPRRRRVRPGRDGPLPADGGRRRMRRRRTAAARAQGQRDIPVQRDGNGEKTTAGDRLQRPRRFAPERVDDQLLHVVPVEVGPGDGVPESSARPRQPVGASETPPTEHRREIFAQPVYASPRPEHRAHRQIVRAMPKRVAAATAAVRADRSRFVRPVCVLGTHHLGILEHAFRRLGGRVRATHPRLFPNHRLRDDRRKPRPTDRVGGSAGPEW